MWHPYPPTTRWEAGSRNHEIHFSKARGQVSQDRKGWGSGPGLQGPEARSRAFWPAQDNGGRRGGPKELGLMAGSVTPPNKRPGRRGLEE